LHTLSAKSGLRASMQQKTGFSRSDSQHGLLMVGADVGVVVGARVGHTLPMLVLPMPLL
jgi:hypothetical protein